MVAVCFGTHRLVQPGFCFHASDRERDWLESETQFLIPGTGSLVVLAWAECPPAQGVGAETIPEEGL